MSDTVENDLPSSRLSSLNRVLFRFPVEEDVQFRYFGNPTAVDFAVQLDHELHSHSLSPMLQNSALGAAFENLRRGKVWRLRSWTRWGLGTHADGGRSADRAFRSQVDTEFQGISFSRDLTFEESGLRGAFAPALKRYVVRALIHNRAHATGSYARTILPLFFEVETSLGHEFRPDETKAARIRREGPVS